ncbi:MAG: hypothetical protein ACPL3P_07275 [Anaerolineales bacterium]
MIKTNHLLSKLNTVGVILLLSACNLPSAAMPTPYPTQYLPTIIAQTIQAQNTIGQNQMVLQPSETSVATPPSPKETLLSPTAQPNTPTVDPNLVLPLAITPPSVEPIPSALIQFRSPGPFSKVVSPFTLYAYLKPGKGGQVEITLYGEDWRVLVRQIKPLPYINRQGFATLYESIPFEIPGTAEASWLSLAVMDEFGRKTSVNSVPLILLSIGQADIIPPADTFAPIVIQQPSPMTLIQGNKVIASGLARSGGDTYLMMQLINQSGNIIGNRVTDVKASKESGLGTFIAEVPYIVDEVTPALLVVWQGKESISNVIYLSSVEVLLSP